MVSALESNFNVGTSLWQRLVALDVVRQQQSAFTCATGLPLVLLPARDTAACGNGDPAKGVFCIQGCMGGQSGDVCQRLFHNAERRAADRTCPVQYRCPTGLVKIIAPVLIGGRHAGNVVAGPFSLQSLNEASFSRLKKRLAATGREMQVDRLRTSWRFSPVISSERGRALATMVNLFAQYLSECGGRLLREAKDLQSPLLRRIQAVLSDTRDASISVKEIAERVSLSPCHFCKVFKKQVGVTFTEYRLKLRIERAQELLRNPHLRVSEVAFEAGFESIPYFNRAFRREAGCSPSQYRARHGGKIKVN